MMWRWYVVWIAMLGLWAGSAQAVEFSWKDMADTTHSLADYQGKPVAVHFWASWCSPCLRELPEYSAWQSANPDIPVIVVSLDDQIMKAWHYVDGKSLNIPVLHTPMSATSMFNLRGLPSTVLIDADGNIKRLFTGPLPWGAENFTQRLRSDMGLTDN